MPNPLDDAFARCRTEGRAAFLPFLPAGDPDPAFTADLLTAAAGCADVVEIGFPFSDPVADGPVIQESYARALAAGLKLADVFAMLERVPPAVPRVAMASYSLIYRRGPERFLKDAQAAHLSGAVVPDLPVEEADEFARHCRDCDFKLILLVTPTTASTRAARIAAACSGFVYVVSTVGITGERAAPFDAARELVTRLRSETDLPLCVGFGIGTPAQAREVASFADGAIVGTALVKLLKDAKTNRAECLAKVTEAMKDLKKGMERFC